jgi:uncharacterized protein YbcI
MAIPMSGPEASDNPDGSRLARVSVALVRAKSTYYGMGPTKAKAYLNDDCLFCVMEGGLTASEETLLRAGEHDLVRSYRLKWQEVMAPVLMAEVAEIMERTALSYHSQIMFDPTRLIEMFVLEPKREG